MYLILDGRNVIVDIVEEAVITDRGIETSGTIYAKGLDLSILEVSEVPSGVVPQEYKYEDGQFKINEDYVQYDTTEDKIISLQDQIQGLQQAMAELTILLAGGEA